MAESAIEWAAEGTSIKFTEGTIMALTSLAHLGLGQKYISPILTFLERKYNESTMPARIGLWGFGIGAMLPVGCVAGFVFMASLGCLMVACMALIAIEILFAMVALWLVLPMMGVMVWAGLGIWRTFWMIHRAYRVICAFAAFIRGLAIFHQDHWSDPI